MVEAIQRQVQNGTTFGTPCEGEVHLAETIQRLTGVDSLRFVSSGTEATMSAIRLARGYTGRDKVVKFSGCYHGHADHLLVSAGSGLVTFGEPSSAGVPQAFADCTLVVPLDDLEALESLFERQGSEIAAVILEPIPANNGLLLQRPEFLQALRRLTESHGAVLIFDEVISGFRVAPGGAWELYGIQPDMVCYGKIVGGGLPVGAFGGTRKIMNRLAPLGPVYQAGTLSGNPLAMAAGQATLQAIEDQDGWQALEALGRELEAGLVPLLARFGFSLVRQGSLFWMNLQGGEPPRTAECIADSAAEHYRILFHSLMEEGIAIAPSAYEVGFLSLAHTSEDLQRFVRAMGRALDKLDVETPRMKRSRSIDGKGLMVTMLILFGVCFAQASYWVVDQMGFARSFYNEVEQVIEHERVWANQALEPQERAQWVQGHPHLAVDADEVVLNPTALAKIEGDVASRINRYRWEGAFFLVVLGLGVGVLVRTLRQHSLLLRRQRNFMASVGHELKSPLASIKLSAETLEMRACPPEQVRSLNGRILQAVARLETFIGNVMESARLEEGGRDPQRDVVRIASILRESVQQMGTRYPGVSIHTCIEGPCEIYADALGVQAVVQNLIDNACKSTQAEETEASQPIQVELLDQDESIVLKVRDEGLGFDPGEASRIFQRFYRVGDELTRKTEGSGLGLHIAKAAMDREGGALAAQSQGPGQGATFTARWPKRSKEARA